MTDTIDRFVEDGIRLASGKTLPADVIVTATGLELQLVSGVALRVDGAPLDLAGRLQYKGMMFRRRAEPGVAFGYTNASWTLKADLTCAIPVPAAQHDEEAADAAGDAAQR